MGAPTPYVEAFEAPPYATAMTKQKPDTKKPDRRTFTAEFKQEAVQMLLDVHSASSVFKNLGIGSTNLSYRLKVELVASGGPVATIHFPLTSRP